MRTFLNEKRKEVFEHAKENVADMNEALLNVARDAEASIDEMLASLSDVPPEAYANLTDALYEVDAAIVLATKAIQSVIDLAEDVKP